PVGDFELLLCHGTVCVVGKIRDLILQLSKSSIYSTKPQTGQIEPGFQITNNEIKDFIKCKIIAKDKTSCSVNF
ncbi:hypothetical protein ACUNG6_26650, partial [Serratia sp. IR-2025]